MKKARAAAFFAAVGAVTAGVLLIPTPLRVQGTLVLTPAKPAIVYAEVPGRLVELEVHDGDYVKSGSLLAKLSNPEKIREREQLQRDHDVYVVKADALDRSDKLADHGLAEEYRDNAMKLEPALERLSEQIGKLNLYSPRDGQAIGVPLPETTGQFLKPGKPFCEVGDPTKLEAHLILDQTDVDLIKAKNKAWIKIYGDSERTIRSKVRLIAKRNRDEIPPELSNAAGGEIATKQDPKTGGAKPLNAVYEVVIPVDNSSLHLQPGLRGFAKIDGGYSPLGWWLWRLITKTFHFTL